MQDSRKTEIRVGVLTIIGIILFLLIFGWAKDIQLFGEDQILNIKFPSVAGLEVGDRVTVYGIRKGYVDKIDLVSNEVIVTAVIDTDTKLYDDAEISIMMLDMMGGKKIEINPGNSQKLMDLSEMQQGKFVGDLATAMAALSEVQEDLVDVVSETKKTIISINNLFNDDKLQTELKSSVSNMNNLSKKLSKIVNQNEAGFNRLIDNGNQLVESANKMISDNSENIKSAVLEMNTVVQNSNSLITKLDKLAGEVADKKNNVGKLLYDEKLLDDLKITIEQVKLLTEILIEQLQNEGVNVDAHIF
jgi:phospholipid/cholesterol/gamma-HCH transport system substrate-binding protein